MEGTVPEFKIVMIGDAFVGKTSLVNRYWGQQFNSNETPTIAASYIQVPTEVKNKNGSVANVKLNIWDTAGTEKFQCLVPLYARTADSLVIVFDTSNPSTFEGAKKWYLKVLEDTGANPIPVLCANKSDLAKGADFGIYKEWADRNNILFHVTSALTGTGVNEAFQELAQKLYSREIIPSQSTDLNEKKEKKSCC